MSIEAMKLALEALDIVQPYYTQNSHVKNAITALRTELERVKLVQTGVGIGKAEQAKPVAWMDEEMTCIFFDTERPEPFDFDFWKPLYTTPPPRQPLTADEISSLRREVAALSANALDDYKMIQSLMAERQPLTDEEIDVLVMDSNGLPTSHLEFARAIEAKLKEKSGRMKND